MTKLIKRITAPVLSLVFLLNMSSAGMAETTVSICLFLGLQMVLQIVLILAPYFASLKGRDGFQSLVDSIKLALPNFLEIFLALFIVSLIAIPVVIFTIGLGILVIVPFVQLVAYDIFAQLTEE